MIRQLQSQIKDKVAKEMIPNQYKTLVETLLDQAQLSTLINLESKSSEEIEQTIENVILLMQNLMQARNV